MIQKKQVEVVADDLRSLYHLRLPRLWVVDEQCKNDERTGTTKKSVEGRATQKRKQRREERHANNQRMIGRSGVLSDDELIPRLAPQKSRNVNPKDPNTSPFHLDTADEKASLR